MPLISDPPPTTTNRKKKHPTKKNMVSPPQPTEKKNGVPPSQVDLNGTALIMYIMLYCFFCANNIHYILSLFYYVLVLN